MANEKRLIDANALIAEYDRVHIGPPGGARKLIEDAPTVDAVEVVHGRWEKAFWHPYRCSCCGETALLDRNGEFYCTSNYCPNCGAKMDGERKDNG